MVFKQRAVTKIDKSLHKSLLMTVSFSYSPVSHFEMIDWVAVYTEAKLPLTMLSIK